jgi:SAM-dependent methyltransferase
VTLAYADDLRKHGVEFVSDLSQLSGQQFDVVILSHVLEHLLEPAKMLAELGALLKPDGRLLVLVPLESPVRAFSPRDNNHHLLSWNAHTLHEFLVASGYMVRSCEVKRTFRFCGQFDPAAKFRPWQVTGPISFRPGVLQS